MVVHKTGAGIIAAAGAVIGGATSAAASACFVEGTPVLTETGLIPIEEVTAGMMVWSADPETGETALRCVVQTFVRETDELTHVTIADENGNTEIITCTPEHPFYVEGRGWIGAGTLHRGMKVRFASGASGIVKNCVCEELPEPVAVYNFEVEEFHTYYVGTTSALVHNMCAKKADIKQVEQAGKELKMDRLQRREFGDYVEYVKKKNGLPNDYHFPYKELIRIGEEFLDE